jgi:Tfp pilus assembly protein PilE
MKPPAPPRFHARQRRPRGVCLIECLVYISVLFVILAVAGAAYARVLDHTRQMRRVAADIARALEAGERWRADLRAATASPRLVAEGQVQALHLPRPDAEVVYFFDGSNVVRRAGADASWQTFLPRVKASRFVAESREHVHTWRWEVELQSGPRPARTPPLFSFTAVTQAKPAP